MPLQLAAHARHRAGIKPCQCHARGLVLLRRSRPPALDATSLTEADRLPGIFLGIL